MSSGFRFPPPPPPPPPPPKALSSDTPNPYSSHRGGGGRDNTSARVRGSHQNGSRGVNHQIGRGSHRGSHRGNHRGSHHGSHRGGNRGGRGASQSYRTPHETQHQCAHSASQAHSNTYPDPSASVGSGALVQAMAFMATPAGMHSMAAFANHMATDNEPALNGQTDPSQQPSTQIDSRKRKRSDRAGLWHAQQQQQQGRTSTAKPPKAKAKAAPAVPGFGFSLPALPASTPISPPKAAGGRTKKRMNLGLTQANHISESGDEEDEEDEEAAFAAKWDGQGITFEHDGDVISLQTGAEVAAYIKDRKKNYPTQARMAEKAQEAQEKRANELEFIRKLKGLSKPEQTFKESQTGSLLQNKKTLSEQSHVAIPLLENLPKKVKHGKESNHCVSVPPTSTAGLPVDLGVHYGTGTDTEANSDSDATSSILSESSVVSSSDSSDNVADSSDDDTPPESQSSKTPIAPVVPPPLPRLSDRAAADSDQVKIKVCPQWRATGRCKFKYCRYKHAEEQPNFVGLYERMVGMELEKADRLALDAIKYLGRNGFLG